MSIIAAEMVWRLPVEVSDAGTNGGRMTATAIATAVKNNVFPDVPQSERTSGSTKYRKVFVHIANDADLTLVAPKVFVETRTPGDDNVIFFAATQRNTQSAITGSEVKFGAGVLNANVSAAAVTLTVLVEDAANNIFPNGTTIRISDKADINAAGNEEYRVTSNCSYAGNVATLTITVGLSNGYSSTTTKVASVYSPGDCATVIANFAKSSTAGTYNNATYPPLGDSISTVEQDWTLTFTSGTAFNISGDVLGVIGTGNTSSDATPTNPSYSKPYFTLRSVGFGGTWIAGDTITFKTSPASIPLWYRRVVPAAANSLSGNSVIVAVDGESA